MQGSAILKANALTCIKSPLPIGPTDWLKSKNPVREAGAARNAGGLGPMIEGKSRTRP